MIIDLEIVNLGDNIYASKLKHEKLGLLKSIVEAKSLSDAKNKINMNMKQCMWKKGVSSKYSPVTFNFIARNLNKEQISLDKTPNDLKQYHPDVVDPKIWSLEEIDDGHGNISYRTIKHDRPLMSKEECKLEIAARMFK